MQSADTILANGLVVTMNADFEIIQDGAIAIVGDSIIDVGNTNDLMSRYRSAEIVDCKGHAIIPGLINAHTHAPMTLMRGLADDLRLDVWLIGFMMPTEREFVNPEFVRLGTRLACAEMIKSGITTFNDMYYFEDSVAETASAVGMRAVCGQTVMKYRAPDARSYEDSLGACRDFIEKWNGHPLITPAVAPHAPYTCTAEILEACAGLAMEFEVPLHIHISETLAEVTENRKQYGMPVVPWVKKQGLFQAKVIAAHCVHLDEGEIRTLHHHSAGVAHNPTSNLKLASGIAPVRQMLDIGLNVGIGTDGAASNNDLDMFEETRLAALIAKAATDNPTSVPAKDAFAMATSMGAKALHLGNMIGSLETGKRADIAVVELGNLHNWPHFSRGQDSVFSQLVYATKSTDVAHVMCNGRWLMRDRNLFTIDTDETKREANLVALQIDSFLTRREGDILSKLLAIGELQQEESFEIQVKARLPVSNPVDQLLAHPDVKMIRFTHYRQHDTYFEFIEPHQARVRYREDDAIDAQGDVTNVRTRLTLTEQGEQRELTHTLLLSRSRYISSATRTLRFYREYFQGARERTLTKDRRRWHIEYKGLLMYVNVDHLDGSTQDSDYLEIKSRTWSLNDAETKAKAIHELLKLLNIADDKIMRQEYLDLVEA